MKLIIILLSFSPTISFSQNLVTGVGGTYGSAIDSYGINGREYVFIGKHICFGPELSYFPKTGITAKSLVELNFTGHYIFELTEHMGFYPLTGLNYSIEREIVEGIGEKESGFGLNLGVGIHYRVKNLFPFMEYKYILGGLSQHLVSLGILFSFSKKKKHEE
ncbi:MAG: hypothetical protein COA33_012660 [Fluviicola sp.]|nr:hypothetical protein [Fluviicola sp.]